MPGSEADSLDALLVMAMQLEGTDAARRILRIASALLEHCAYEFARSDAAGQVSRIILISAELERIAKDGDKPQGFV